MRLMEDHAIMNRLERLHFLHRAWRYRLRAEKFGVAFLLSRDLAGKTAVDIGAHWGVYSYWMHRLVGAQGHVIAFEPQPELAAHLRDLRDCFRLRRLEIAEMGVSSEIGERTLRRPKTHWGGAGFEGKGEDGRDLDLIRTRVTTLDDYFENHPACPIRFIKCDVEGHEHPVFRGSRRVLTEDRPDLLFECLDGGNPRCEVFSYLTSLEYAGYCFFDGGLAPVADYASLLPGMHRRARVDFVFLPRERTSAETKR
jgi:FkbM family methyltransferase